MNKQEISETEFLSFDQSLANIQQCERCEIMEQHINQLKTEIDVLTEELMSKNHNQLENSFQSLQQDIYDLKTQLTKSITDEQQLLNKIEYLAAENQILKLKVQTTSKKQLGYAKIKSISIKPQKSLTKIFEPFQPINVSDLRQSMKQIDKSWNKKIELEEDSLKKESSSHAISYYKQQKPFLLYLEFDIQAHLLLYQLMQSAPVSHKKKSSFFDSIKQFFYDAPQEKEGGVINEATVYIPSNSKGISKQKHEQNQSMPVQQHNFQIGNDEREQLSEDVFDVDDKKNEEQFSQDLDGYKIMEVKRVDQQGDLLPTEGYLKHQVIEFPPDSTFKIKKVMKKSQNILDYFRNQVDRHLALDGGWLYIMEKKKEDSFKVKSVTGLNKLEKVLVKENETKPHLRLIFQEQKIKLFSLRNKEQEQMFFIKLKNELQKHRLDL